MMTLKNLILSLSPRQRMIWGSLTILLPFFISASFTVSALRSDALDDRRSERLLRTFADRLETDGICERLAGKSQDQRLCLDAPSKQDKGLVTEL